MYHEAKTAGMRGTVATKHHSMLSDSEEVSISMLKKGHINERVMKINESQFNRQTDYATHLKERATLAKNNGKSMSKMH